MKSALEIFGYGIAIIALCVFIFFFFAWLLGAIALFAVVAFICWLCGVPITITKNGRKSVYRWTKRIR